MRDWIEWRGGQCPVPPHVHVAVQMRRGTCADGPAGIWAWPHGSGASDIVRYRVLGDEPVPAPSDWKHPMTLSEIAEAEGPALSRQEGGGHYTGMAIQPFEYIHANGLGFAEGCVVKYVSRWRVKNGVEDLKKARHFLDLLIEAEGKK